MKIIKRMGFYFMKLSKNIAKITAAVAGAVALGTFATATSANADSIYTVQSGDTLSEISYKFGHDLSFVDSLATNNNIADKNVIYVGQKLVIKDDGEVAPATQQEVATLPAANTENTASSAADTQSQAVAQQSSADSQQAVAQSSTASVAQPQAQSQQAATTATTTTSQAPAQTATTSNTTTTTSYTSTVTGGEAAAKAAIAQAESGGSYTATNGQYIGKYQLSASYLNGDYSAANQERVADQYVAQRYGSWSAALSFRNAHGWY